MAASDLAVLFDQYNTSKNKYSKIKSQVRWFASLPQASHSATALLRLNYILV